MIKFPRDQKDCRSEESLRQLALRAQRLGLDASDLQCVTATGVEQVLALAERESIAAYFLLRLGNEFDERMSPLFASKVLRQ